MTVPPGSENRAKTRRGFPGTWDARTFPAYYWQNDWVLPEEIGAARPQCSAASGSASDRGEQRRQTHRTGIAKRRITKRRETGVRESEQFIVPSRQGHITAWTLRREGAAGSRNRWRET